jgi:glycosyltransferase involved in cell wall biosynthesis
MRVAVITPYYKEDLETLVRCHSSVAKQTYKDVVHYMVADGHPINQVNAWECEHIVLPPCLDTGDTPRLVGFAVASVQGYDAICLLDADNWLEPDHVEALVNTMNESGSPVVTCPRNLYELNGKFMAQDTESDGRAFNDTNCYLIHRSAYLLFHSWITKPSCESLVGDRYFWNAVCASGVPLARSMKATVNYTTTYAFHYKVLGLPVPDHAKVIANLGDGYKTYNHKEVSV